MIADRSTLKETITTTFSDLTRTFSGLKEDLVNQIPFKDSWTAAQVVQHVVLSANGFVQMINDDVKDADRKSDLFAENIKNIFLDFSTKMQSPDFIVPESKKYQKEKLLSKLEEIKDQLIKNANTLVLDKLCITFELPVFGFLTRLEAIYFVIYHTQRHTHQLKEILKELN